MQPDFFNNVAAVAVVLMFTKIVTHRSRTDKPTSTRNVAAYHVATVIATACAIVVALIATEVQSQAIGFHILAWLALGVAGLILIIDEFGQARPG
jgi:undecaprenyl pyrophosphate phosphatase UppP